MKLTKEQIRDNRGITLVSLILTIVIIFVITSTTVHISLDRFEINRYNKMKNDIELLSDKVSNYYLKYNGLPILRDSNNNSVKYTTINFETNEKDNNNYYILDLEAMEGIALNYGKEGFESLNSSNDVYIINEKTHIIYYVKGIEVGEKTYHTTQDDTQIIIDDKIPPTKPQINVITGTTDDDGIYISEVEIAFVSGKDSVSGIKKTTYFINEEAEKEINNIKIKEDGTYKITTRAYDQSGNISEEVTKTIKIQKRDIVLDNTNLILSIEDGETTATGTIKATLNNVTKDLKWTASKDSGLIISGEGNTKTIVGTKVIEDATITVSYGNLKATSKVTVEKTGQVE